MYILQQKSLLSTGAKNRRLSAGLAIVRIDNITYSIDK